MNKPKMGIDLHFFVYHCDCDKCPSSGESVTKEEMDKTISDLTDWLGERGLVFGGSYKLADINSEDV